MRSNVDDMRSGTCQLGNLREVLVSRDQHKIVLKRHRGDPKIVVGDGSAGPLELYEQSGVLLGRIPVWKQESHRRFGEKGSQNNLVPLDSAAAVEASLNLGKYNQRHPYFVASSEPLGQRRVALEKIGQPIRVERDPHFHLSQST